MKGHAESQPQPQPATNSAQTYEDYFVAYQFRPWTEELLDRARPQPGERVLDIACGTGIVARTVASRLNGQAQLVGIDLSPAMLEVARATAEREGVEVEWRDGNAESLPFPAASFDLALVQQGLQFFRDKGAATAEMYRVLAPGGRAATATWTEIANNPFHEVFAEIIQQHLGSPAAQTPFSLGNRDTLRSLFAEAGFTDIEIEAVSRPVRFPSPDQFVELGVAGFSAAIPELQSTDAAARARLTEAIRADMAHPLRQFTEGNEVVIPLQAHVVVARKSG